MAKDIVYVGVANEGQISLPIDIVEKWEVKNVNQFGDTVFFKVEDMYFSMNVSDYKEIFKI